jgi:hypothetical protein
MFLKIAACVVLLSSCAVGILFGQSAPQASTNEVRVPPLSTEATAQFAVIRSEGIPDEVVSLNCVAMITAMKIENNVIMFSGINHLAEGQQVRLSKFNRAEYLNGVTLKVSSATADTFTASFTHADVPMRHDGGTALRTDCGASTTLRSNQKVEVFHNNFNFFRQHLSSNIEIASYNQFFPNEQDAHYTSSTFSQPSYSWGNSGGWGVQKDRYEELTFNSRGIAQAHNLWCYKHAVGDVACGDYIYAYTDGGSTAQSDEGFTVDTRQGGETDSYFHGTVGQGATAGATLLPVTFTSGQDATTDGAFLLDISKGTIHGTVSGLDAIVDKTSVHILPVTLAAGHLSPSTGIGIIQTPIPIISIANVPESVTLDVALTHGTFKPGIACLAGGWYPEQVSVTAVSEANGAAQKVTLIHKNPNPTVSTDPNNPSSLWQGGPCGSYLSLDRNLERDGFRTSYQVVGATDTNHVAYMWNVNGTTLQNGIKLYADPVPLNNLVRKNGIVTARFAKTYTSFVYNHAPSIVIANASDHSFDGVMSSPVYENGQNLSLSWTQAGPDAKAASATMDLPTSSYGFHLYPGAEVLAPRTPNGVPLEPNSVVWASGDVIENPHNPSFQMRFRANGVTQHTLPSGGDSHAEMWGFRGAGISANFRPSTWTNENPCKLYVGCGGTLDPITWTIHSGPYSILQRVESAPMNGGAIFRIGCDSSGCNHPGPYALFVMQNGAISYDPATSTVSTAVFKAGSVSFDKVSLSTASDRASDCLGVINHVLVSGNSQAQETPCISSINWHGGSGLTVQQSGSASHPSYTIVPEPGYYIPKLGAGRTSDAVGSNVANASAAAVTVGPNIAHGAVACMNGYRCDSDRGRLELTAGSGSSAGKIAHVQAKLAAGQICTATQNGGTVFFGIGSGGENTSGFDITSAIALAGKAVIDYSCH